MDQVQKSNHKTPPLRMKGVGDSLWITFDPSLRVELLQNELDILFKPLKNLSKDVRVILDTGQADGYDDLLDTLGKYLKKNFHVKEVIPPPPNQMINQGRIRQRDMNHYWHNYSSDVLMLAGRVRSGQKVTTPKHLLILGDVNPGAEVAAGGDILVMGSLCGTAFAGQPDNPDVMILALDFRPTQIQIGKFVAAGADSEPTYKAEFAHVENGAIVVEDYLKTNPFKRLPWPQVR